MSKLLAGQQGLSNPFNYPPNYPPSLSRREEQKAPADEASRRNPPLNNLRSEVKSTSDKGGSKPTEKERKVETQPVEVGHGRSNEPANSLVDITNGSAGGSALGSRLSDDQFRDVVREAPEVKPLDDHKEEGRNDYIGLFEARIMALERELRVLRRIPPVLENTGGDDSKLETKEPGTRPPSPVLLPAPIEDDSPLAKITYQSWGKFQGTESRGSVVKVLLGDLGIPRKSKKGGVKKKGMAIRKTNETSEGTTEKILPNRIRVHSPHILKILKKVSSVNPRHDDSAVFLRPFKTLIYCEGRIRREVRLLEDEAMRAGTIEERKEIGVQDEAKTDAGQQDEEPHTTGPQNKPEASPPSQDDIKQAEQALVHARLLEEFIDTELRGVLDLRRTVRKRRVKLISFGDLWLLFNPGDIVYSRAQAFQVFSTSGCQPLDRKKAHQYRQEVRLDGDGHQLYREHETVSPFVIDCYYISFDGRKYGPVQKTFRIPAYDGERQITTLPICPEGFFDASRRESLFERGKSFLSLTGEGGAFAHRQYDGVVTTPDGEKEEVNSRVIIDFTTAFRMHPQWCPDLGLNGASAPDPREITSCGGNSGDHGDPLSCFHCHYDYIWEDHRYEQMRASEYMDHLDLELGKLQRASDLTPDQIVLLPDRVYGFVLRNRKWVTFTIDDISNVTKTEEDFRDLVLPQKHKSIVEALVRTHSRGSKPANRKEPQRDDARRHVDLVRGKGEGIIMLLHGPPGVGKTSTAECVAGLCNRPLFQITCGDIGIEPRDVERNLDDNFRLAHRWGCVLLLDEADVFLTERGGENLKRNSLVSVFLRVLEYYPGILILTTNRVGKLDEALKSRIHISLQYRKLDKTASLRIWENNIRRAQGRYDVDKERLMKFARRTFPFVQWNGRQIKNAFQVVIALAEFDAIQNPRFTKSGEPGKVTLRLKWFREVADASKEFDDYIKEIYGGGDDGERALISRARHDEYGAEQRDKSRLKLAPQLRTIPPNEGDSPASSTTSPSLSSTSESSDELSSDPELQRRHPKKGPTRDRGDARKPTGKLRQSQDSKSAHAPKPSPRRREKGREKDKEKEKERGKEKEKRKKAVTSESDDSEDVADDTSTDNSDNSDSQSESEKKPEVRGSVAGGSDAEKPAKKTSRKPRN